MKSTAIFLFILSSFLSVNAQVTILVHTDTSIHTTLSGRLYVYMQSDTAKPVPQTPDPIQPQPAFAKDLKNWDRNTAVIFDASATSLTLPLNQLKPGYYKIAALLDRDPEERGVFNAGNYYSRNEAILQIDASGKGEAHIVLNAAIRPRVFRESENTKEVKLKSGLLSRFRKKDIFLRAGVRLPASYYKDSLRRYPVVFIIPGWGGRYYDITGSNAVTRYGMQIGKEKIYVYLDPEAQTPFGLHAWVDSRVNGPWGKSLIEELIPYLQQQFRITTEASQRFVVGQSTGGYAALWLQLNYPDAFGGCWAVSPDPVDFSEFTGINVYNKESNFFYDQKGGLIPFFLDNGKPLTTMKAFADVEKFLGDGEQLQSFEAEFGVPDKQGRPRMAFDRETGKINPKVIRTWEPYDMGLFIRKNWGKLAASLAGKVHVYAGSEDNFTLNKAVAAFARKAESVKAALVAEIIPGANHFTIWSTAFTQRVQREIDSRIGDK
jgi:S-formylglutathione hydrolase FrmB